MGSFPDKTAFDALARRVEVLEKQVAELRGPAREVEVSAQETLIPPLATIATWATRELAKRKTSLDKSKDRLVLIFIVDPLKGGNAQAITLGELLEENPEGVAGLAAAAGHPVRTRVLDLLAQGEKGARELGEALGLEGGPLYHHLHELMKAGLIRQPERSRYALTDYGVQLLLTLAATYRRVREDKGVR